MLKVMMISAVSVGFLAGCSSDDTASSYDSFAEIEPDAVAMLGAYVDGNGVLLDARATGADIPDDGESVYNGFISGDVTGTALIGELEITATFAAGNNGAITTEATNFFDEKEVAYSGTLSGTGNLLRSPLPSTDPQVDSNLVGTLFDGISFYDANLLLEGDFVADGADPVGAIAGIVDGTIDGEIFLGEFAAER